MIINDQTTGNNLLKASKATIQQRFYLTRNDGDQALCTIYVTQTGQTWLETVMKDAYSIEPVVVEYPSGELIGGLK